MTGEKSPREHKISPIWFPFHPPSMTWRADCFPAPRVDRKQAGLVGIKEKGEGDGQEIGHNRLL